MFCLVFVCEFRSVFDLCYNILVISHAYNRGYGTGYAITLYGIYIIRYHLMTYVSHLKPEGLTSSPLRGLTHDSTWLA